MPHPLHTCLTRVRSATGKVVGAGFVIADDRICTCAHVVALACDKPEDLQERPAGCVQVDLPFLGGEPIDAEVELWQPVGAEPPEDFAVLRVQGRLPRRARPARLVGPDHIAGHRFTAFGLPTGTDIGAFAYGAFGQERPNGTIQLDRAGGEGFPIEHGFSGAPVWDEHEHGVAAMVVTAWDDAERAVAFATPSTALAATAGGTLRAGDGDRPFAVLTAGVDAKRTALEGYLGLHIGPPEARVPYAGRKDATERLDDWLDDSARPYCLVFGDAGRGKSALLTHWALATAAAQRAEVAFAPINIDFGIDEEEPVIKLLVQRIRHLHGADAAGAGADELEQLLRAGPAGDGPLLVVIDGVDEAAGWQPERRLPFRAVSYPGVKVVVSARPLFDRGLRGWLGAFKWANLAATVQLPPLDRDAIVELVGQISPRTRDPDPARLAEQLEAVTDGDPLVVSLYAHAVHAGELSADALARAEKGLHGFVSAWWRAQEAQWAQEGNPIGRSDAMQHLLDVLAMARGPIGREDLARLAGVGSSWTFDGLNDVGRWVVERGGAEPGYVLSHTRLAKYFRDQMLASQRAEVRETLVDFCLEQLRRRADGKPRTQGSGYALSHAVDHLADALRDPATPDAAERARQLAELVTDERYEAIYLADTGDLAGLRRDLGTALAAIAGTDAAALPDVVRVALGVWTFHDSDRMRPDVVFEHAEEGRISDAQARLAVFEPDEGWRQAARLLIAWLAAETNHAGACKLHEDVARELSSSAPLPLLRDRVAAALHLPGASAPELPPLPPPPDEAEAEMLVASASGTQDPSMLARLHEGLSGGPGKPPVLAARIHAPRLVAFSVVHRASGPRVLGDYIATHLDNPYREYRNSSLWQILDAALSDPDDSAARTLIRRLADGALSAESVAFTYALPIALDALAAEAGDGRSAERFESRRRKALETADRLLPTRGRADSWGHISRTMAAQAEAAKLVPHRPELAPELLHRALSVHAGYSGFQAPASVTLSEAFLVTGGDEEGRAAALDAALQAAHNIQEPSFCARATARVNAIRAWWQAPRQDATATVTRFAAEPLEREFASLHVIGERYEHRAPEFTMELPAAMRNAATLAQLAGEVFRAPLSDFLRVNPPLKADQRLSPGTEVRVPDRGFGPQLAARLSADVITQEALSRAERVRLIRLLVPASASRRTTLDRVLARLVLAAHVEREMLGELQGLAESATRDYDLAVGQ